MEGRYFCFTLAVRVNQIEVMPGVNIGVDERRENTLENFIKYRTAIAKAAPDAKITIAFSHQALLDKSDNFVSIREKAKQYNKEYGDDITYLVGAFFGGAYSSRDKINLAIDEGLMLLRSFMGENYLPGSIIGGFLPAAVIQHIASLKIRSVQGNIFSQYAIDNQDGEGSMCYPYYPSSEHFCKPAQGEKDFIDCVNFDGWTVDFINAMYRGVTPEGYNSRMGCGPIETLRPFGEQKGMEIIMQTAGQMLLESYALNKNFGMAAAIWELCLIQKDGHHKMGIDETAVGVMFSEFIKRYPGIKFIPYGELGEIFRKTHKDNSKLDYRFIHRGTGNGGSDLNKQIKWFMNKLFRLAVITDLTTGKETVVDFTDYTKTYSEPGNSDYFKGIIQRNWSIIGTPNQKNLNKN